MGQQSAECNKCVVLFLVKIVDFSVSVSRPSVDFVAHPGARNAPIDSAEAKSSFACFRNRPGEEYA